MKTKLLILLFLSLLLSALGLPSAFAAGPPPPHLNYQGTLLDAGGLPVTATQTITFSFYTAATGGTPFWQEVQSVTPDAGVFNVLLGSITPLDPAAFAGSAVWLGVRPQGSAELTPRQPLASAVYALLSGDTDTLDGYHAADFYTRSALSISGGGGQVHWDNLLGTPTNLTQIAALVCAAGEVARWDGSVWACDVTTPAWNAITGMPSGFADGTDDNTTYTAGSGLVLSGTTFSVVTNTIQARVSSTCAAGSSIRTINADGTVICEPDDNSGGDITAVTAGTGLTGGATTGAATINADTTYLQRRVSSTCAAGSSIRTINADGTVICEPDDNSGGDITAVTAGTGLTGGATTGAATINADTTYLQRRVSSTCAAGSSIRTINADGTVICEPDSLGVSSVWGGTGLLGGGYASSITLGVDSTYVQRRVSSTCTAGSAIRTINVDGTVICETVTTPPVIGCRISGSGAFAASWADTSLNTVENDTTTGCWTPTQAAYLSAPVTGYYETQATVTTQGVPNTSVHFGVMLSHCISGQCASVAGDSAHDTPTGVIVFSSATADMLYLTAGDQIRVQTFGPAGTGYTVYASLRYLGN